MALKILAPQRTHPIPSLESWITLGPPLGSPSNPGNHTLKKVACRQPTLHVVNTHGASVKQAELIRVHVQAQWLPGAVLAKSNPVAADTPLVSKGETLAALAPSAGQTLGLLASSPTEYQMQPDLPCGEEYSSPSRQ